MKKIILAFVALISLAAFTTVTDNYGYKIGDIAEDFKLENIDGKLKDGIKEIHAYYSSRTS